MLLFDGKKFIIESKFIIQLCIRLRAVSYFLFIYLFFLNPVDHSSRARVRDERRSCEEQGRKPKRRKSKSFFRSQPQSLLLLYFFALRAWRWGKKHDPVAIQLGGIAGENKENENIGLDFPINIENR